MTCTRETMPLLSELETKLVFKEDNVKISEHMWCKECSKTYHTICDIIASKFKVPIKNHHMSYKLYRRCFYRDCFFLTMQLLCNY